MSKQDLSWFWESWFFDNGYPDLAISKLTGNNTVIIEKIGSLPVTVAVTYFTVGDQTSTIALPTSVWKTGQSKIQVDLPKDIKIEKIILGKYHIPDLNNENNILYTK